MKLAETFTKRHLLRCLESGTLLMILFVIVCAGALGEFLTHSRWEGPRGCDYCPVDRAESTG